MKKIFTIASLVVILAMISATVAFAQQSKGDVRGEVIQVIDDDDPDDDDDGEGQGKGKGKGQDKNKNKKGGDGDGGKAASAYCSGEKDKEHPFAAGIAETYDADLEEVMGYFCQGFGFGQIMLALQTGKMENVDASVADMLAARESGQGWGQIWKDMDLIGNKDHGKSPPGQLKKPDKGKGPPEGKGWKKDEGD
jgi:hypothetical protein